MKTQIKIIRVPKNEAEHQMNVIAWSQLHRDEYPVLKLLHHIPNGGKRDKVEAKRLKQQGIKPGIPDLCLPAARGEYHGLYIEMKTENGRLTDEQKWCGEQLLEQGYFWEVCHGWESAVRVLEWYLSLPERKATS